MAAMAGPAGQRSGRLFHFVHVLDLLNVVLPHVLGHRDHDPGHLLFRLGIIFEFQPWPPIGPEVIRIGGVAVVAMGSESAGKSFHDVVNLVSRQVFGKHLKVCGSRVVARTASWASGSRRRPLRCLGKGGDGEYCTGENGNRDSWPGQGSYLQAHSSHRELECFQIDGILITKDAPAN